MKSIKSRLISIILCVLTVCPFVLAAPLRQRVRNLERRNADMRAIIQDILEDINDLELENERAKRHIRNLTYKVYLLTGGIVVLIAYNTRAITKAFVKIAGRIEKIELPVNRGEQYDASEKKEDVKKCTDLAIR